MLTEIKPIPLEMLFVTVLNPVVVVVQGRCTSVKRVLTPRSCDRYILVWSQVRNAVVKWSTGCVCLGHASAGRKFEPRECPELLAVCAAGGGREWVVAGSSPGEGASRGDLALGGDECNGAEPCRGSSTGALY